MGRSSAVAVWAWHLAREGKRVLAVDLDLEAPGLGKLLLPSLPDYGLVDWLVECLLGAPHPELLDDALAFSPLADGSAGVIQVMPAFGARTSEYVAKVGRVYLPGVEPAGGERGLAQRLLSLLDQVAQRAEPPDVVLLDARAGLHDIGAAAVTQLGAEVFVFARDEAQSWAAYRLLFEHLRLSRAVKWGMPDDDLRWRLKMVGAQLAKPEAAFEHFVGSSYDAWTVLYDAEVEGGEAEPQTFDRNDASAPHFPLPIYFDGGLQGLDPTDPATRPDWTVLEGAFGRFLRDATARVLPSTDPGGPTEGR